MIRKARQAGDCLRHADEFFRAARSGQRKAVNRLASLLMNDVEKRRNSEFHQ
jgi:hypothetical protein